MRRLQAIIDRIGAPERKAQQAIEMSTSMLQYAHDIQRNGEGPPFYSAEHRLKHLNAVRWHTFELPPLDTLPWLTT